MYIFHLDKQIPTYLLPYLSTHSILGSVLGSRGSRTSNTPPSWRLIGIIPCRNRGLKRYQLSYTVTENKKEISNSLNLFFLSFRHCFSHRNFFTAFPAPNSWLLVSRRHLWCYNIISTFPGYRWRCDRP